MKGSVFMIIAVQKGMGDTGEQLRARGFDVVTYGEYNYPIDAVVYMGNKQSPLMMNMTADNQSSVLMVNATGKTPDDIEEILNRRLYTPLF